MGIFSSCTSSSSVSPHDFYFFAEEKLKKLVNHGHCLIKTFNGINAATPFLKAFQNPEVRNYLPKLHSITSEYYPSDRRVTEEVDPSIKTRPNVNSHEKSLVRVFNPKSENYNHKEYRKYRGATVPKRDHLGKTSTTLMNKLFNIRLYNQDKVDIPQYVGLIIDLSKIKHEIQYSFLIDAFTWIKWWYVGSNEADHRITDTGILKAPWERVDLLFGIGSLKIQEINLILNLRRYNLSFTTCLAAVNDIRISNNEAVLGSDDKIKLQNILQQAWSDLPSHVSHVDFRELLKFRSPSEIFKISNSLSMYEKEFNKIFPPYGVLDTIVKEQKIKGIERHFLKDGMIPHNEVMVKLTTDSIVGFFYTKPHSDFFAIKEKIMAHYRSIYDSRRPSSRGEDAREAPDSPTSPASEKQGCIHSMPLQRDLLLKPWMKTNSEKQEIDRRKLEAFEMSKLWHKQFGVALPVFQFDTHHDSPHKAFQCMAPSEEITRRLSLQTPPSTPLTPSAPTTVTAMQSAAAGAAKAPLSFEDDV